MGETLQVCRDVSTVLASAKQVEDGTKALEKDNYKHASFWRQYASTFLMVRLSSFFRVSSASCFSSSLL